MDGKMKKQKNETGNSAPVDQLSFEQAYAELDEITKSLESDNQTLDQAVSLFERGQALIQHCASLLDAAELKVQQIIGDELSDYFIE
jgi:exodeoxyribonuclease VII small subunit